MRIAVLSYADVRPRNADLLRAAARDLRLDLDEVEPHRLWLRLDDGPTEDGPTGDGAAVLCGDERFTPDVVLHRTVYPYRALVLPLLEQLAATGTVVLNAPAAALRSRNKLATLLSLRAAGLPVVPTAALAEPLTAQALPTGDVLVRKPALGLRGEGVRAGRSAQVAGALREATYDVERGPVLVQPLVTPTPSAPPGAGRYDVRAYVVGERCVALAARRAADGEFRCNVELGASVGPVPDHRMAAEAEHLAVAAVRALGLDHAAVDLLPAASTRGADRLLLSEVDAWGGFAGLQDALGVPVAQQILEYAVHRGGGRRA